MSSGRASRDKGRRGELECSHWLESLGWSVHRVSGDEAGTLGGHQGWDVEACVDGETPWAVQVKLVAANCPAIPRLFTPGVSMAWVGFTGGRCRGRRFLILDAADVPLFVKQAARAMGAGGGAGRGEGDG